MSDRKRNSHSSLITEGHNRAPNRAMLRAVGFGDADFGKPIVGVANGDSNITPCNLGLGDLTVAACEAIRRAVTVAMGGGWSVLVAGKGHENTQIVGNQRLPFSDKDELERAVAEHRASEARG